VEVVDSPAGQAYAAVQLDVDSLLARRGMLQQSVLASAVSSRRVLPETEQPVNEIGQELFAALLGTGEVAGLYRASAAMAKDCDQELRVVLRIDTPALAGLPWEAMFDRTAGEYVCRQHQVVRHVPVASVPAPLQVEPPLRILGVVSSPRGLPALDVEKEKGQLAHALAHPVGQGLVEVHWAPSATWADLQDLLLDEKWHVLHFIGHGDFDPGRDEGVLALEREDNGRADLVAAHRFVGLLRQARPMPRLVVLNSCSGAATGTTDLFSGTASALVRGGVTAVAAMQYEVSDLAAGAFARGFYAAIARGRGIDDAISSGRVAILGLGDRTLEWVTPVLYLRGRGTCLFTLPARTAARSLDNAGTEDVDASRRSRPGGTISSSATGHDPREDSPAGPAPTRAGQPSAAQGGSGRQSAAPGTSRLIHTLIGHTSQAIGVAFSPDGTLLATASIDATARLWAVASGEPVRVLTGSSLVTDVVFSPDGTLLATASTDATAQLWKVASGAPGRILAGHDESLNGVAFSPDGALLATVGDDATARLWDVSSGTPVRTLTGLTSSLKGVAFSPDGTLLAIGYLAEGARLWDVASGTPVLTMPHDGLRGVAFSPDGTLLATASWDRTARLWDVASGASVRTLAGHVKGLEGVAFSPDGTLLATASQDRTARLWDVANGAPVCTLTGHDDWVYKVAFGPDGTLLATVSKDRTARLWGLA